MPWLGAAQQPREDSRHTACAGEGGRGDGTETQQVLSAGSAAALVPEAGFCAGPATPPPPPPRQPCRALAGAKTQ